MRNAKCYRQLTSIGTFLLMLSSTVCSAAVNTPSTEAVRSVAEVYLRVEFQEDTAYNREQLIKFTPRRRAHLESKTEPGLGIYDFYINSGDPVFVVDDYKIVEIDVKGKRATVTVSYNRLGRIMNGMGTAHAVLIPDKKVNDLVTLNLVFEKNKWLVLDPPPPRVSRDVLIRDYEGALKELRESGWLTQPDMSPAQKTSYDNDVEKLRLLKGLP
jgi:hypothetical protein